MTNPQSSILEGVDLSNLDQVFQELDRLRQQLADGLLEDLFQVNEEEHYEALKELVGEDFDEQAVRQRVESAMQNLAAGRGTLKDAFGISEEGMECFYFIGHSMFEKRNYPAARRMFQFLLQLNPFEPRYHHALAATQHKQKDFLAAARSYMSAFALSPVNDPQLHYHCADCFLKMDDTMSAVVALGHCIEGCDERNPLHRQMKLRATSLRELLIRELPKEEAAKSQLQEQQQAQHEAVEKEAQQEPSKPSQE